MNKEESAFKFRNSRFIMALLGQGTKLGECTDCNCEVSLRFLHGHVKIEAASKHGILLWIHRHYWTRRLRIPKYYVCKPSTKEWHHIPNPITHYFTKMMGILVLRSKPIHYKMIQFLKPSSPCIWYKSILYNCLRCEIFYSEIWAWKRLKKYIVT